MLLGAFNRISLHFLSLYFSPVGFTLLVLPGIYITLTICLFYVLVLIFILSCIFPHDKSNKVSVSHIKMHLCSNIRRLQWWQLVRQTHCSFLTQTVTMSKASETKDKSLYHKSAVFYITVFKYACNPRSFQQWPSSMSVHGEKWQGGYIQGGVRAALLETQKFSLW